MGLSTTASFGIVFTASLFMLGIILNSLIHAYTNINEGFEYRNDMLEGQKNVIEIERVIYNSTKIEILAKNNGPKSLKMDKINILINGVIMNFTSTGNYWYPGERKKFFLNSSYSIGENHDIQFIVGAGSDVIASCEKDRVYILTSSGLSIYSYEGGSLMNIEITSPLDVTVDDYIFVLNSTEILVYDLAGNYVRSFAENLGIIGIDAYNGYLYGISSTTFYIFDYDGNEIKSFGVTDGKDVCVGSYVYILEGNSVEKEDYSGNYISKIEDSRITNATKIAADATLGDILFILNGDDMLLIYRENSYLEAISLEKNVNNVDIYGKIYLSGSELYAMNIGYRVKMVDEYGNEIYAHL